MLARLTTFVTLSLVGLAFLALPQPAAAWSKTNCVKPGYKATGTGSVVVLYAKASKPSPVYVCSKRFGKKIYVGRHGSTADGSVGTSMIASVSRYAAFTRTSQGTANSYFGTGTAKEYDLKTGAVVRSITNWADSTCPYQEYSTFVLAPNGNAGWIGHCFDAYAANPVIHPWVVRIADAAGTRTLGSGLDIYPSLLQLVNNGKQLRWFTGAQVGG